MLEISISHELAATHPEFMAHCADRGHAVVVFDSDGAQSRPRETGRSVPDLSPAFEAEAPTRG
jgi:hypothetical protein